MHQLALSTAVALTAISSTANAFVPLLSVINRVTLNSTDPLLPNAFPFTVLSALGYTQTDQLLLLLCPIFATIGGLVRIALGMQQWSERLDRAPKPNAVKGSHFLRLRRAATSVLATAFLAFVAGLLAGLYFAGSIAPTREAIGKLLALALLLGFVAPIFFEAQQRRLAHVLATKLAQSGEA